MGGKLEGRVALITGGGRGIGAGIARVLASEGCAVAVNYRSNTQAAEATCAQITASGGRARAYRCDLGPAFAPVVEMADQVARDFGRLDILVNNAGVTMPAMSTEHVDIDMLRSLIDTNFFGPILATKACLQHLRSAGRSHIVFTSSAAAADTHANRWCYPASKVALEVFAKTLVKEELHHGIRVNIIRPGLVASDLANASMKRRGLNSVEDLRKVAPFGRIAQPEDIGRAVAFLCSEAADYITGTTLSVDGGGVEWLPPQPPAPVEMK